MKAINRYSIYLLAAVAMVGIFAGCDDDEAAGGQPMISYIRVTNPASSDSLLASAGQGQMIAIIGENLQNTVEAWFNDQKAALTATLITRTSIVTRVPSEIPQEITNKLVLVFSNGSTLEYDFSVDISAPVIARMHSEYVNTGDVAVFYGNYFYEPLEVTFSGGVQGEIVEVEDDLLRVRVPDGVEPGPVTITTNFGVAESGFWFRDNRNIIASFDGTTNGLWHGPSFIKAVDDEISAINGKFLRINTILGEWAWFEAYVGPNDSDVALELKNIPQNAFTDPQNYVLKFELNTLASLSGARIHIYIGPTIEPGRQNAKYIWEPNIHTNGIWETVSIPWAEVRAANTELTYDPNGYGTSIHFSGPNAVTANFAIDNMRVVPQ